MDDAGCKEEWRRFQHPKVEQAISEFIKLVTHPSLINLRDVNA